jgi:hypothetical protein
VEATNKKEKKTTQKKGSAGACRFRHVTTPSRVVSGGWSIKTLLHAGANCFR